LRESALAVLHARTVTASISYSLSPPIDYPYSFVFTYHGLAGPALRYTETGRNIARYDHTLTTPLRAIVTATGHGILRAAAASQVHPRGIALLQ